MSGDTLFERVGGREGVEAIVTAFYDGVDGDAPLRALYPIDLTPSREKLILFFEQWLGGEARYSERYGHPRMRRRHFPFVISGDHAERWLGHMKAALESANLEAGDFEVMWGRIEPLAHHMVNEGEDVPREPIPEGAFLT